MNSRSVWNELNKNSKRQLQRNQKYWDVREREKLWHDKLLKESNSYDNHVQRLYRDTIRAVEDEINSFFTRFSGKEGISITEAKKRVSKLDIEAYARKAEKYVPAKDLSKRANDEMRIYNLTMKVNRLEMLKAEIGMHLVDCFDELESFMGEKLSAQVKSEFERQAGILGHTVTNPSKLAQSIVNASFHNATFSERIWSHHDQLRFEIAKQLTSGLVTGKHPRELSRNIRKAFGVSAYNAMRLMRTELARVQTDAQLRCYEQGGYEMFEFITVGIKACPICQALDGEMFKIADMRVGTNAPPMHPNCRCSTSATMPAYDSWKNSGAAKNGVAYKDFEGLYTPGKGTVIFDKGFIKKDNKDEVTQAEWIAKTFGGRIRLLKRSMSNMTPDYKWNDKYWDLKTPKSANGTDKLIHHGLKQINESPGGLIVDFSNQSVNIQEAIKIAERRLHRSRKNKKTIVIVKVRDEIITMLK